MIETLNINTTKSPISKLAETDFNNLPFGQVFTDHMFLADFENGEWKNFELVPYGPIPMSPAISALHYGQAIFEGMKAYKLQSGEISIFRADKNFNRFNISAERMAMPTISEEIFMQGICSLIELDKKWVPEGKDFSLYIRPVMFATDDKLGVRASSSYKFAVLTNPSGPYYSKPLKVKIETHYTRADEGGVGFAKTAGNYGRSLYTFAQAQKEGFDQLIWTDAKEHKYIEESGTANVMFVINNVLVTPALSGTILDGVTRDTVITLAKHLGYTVEERKIAVSEVLDKIKSGELTEAFAVGTAATVTQIGEIGFEDQLYTIPAERIISTHIHKALDDIRYGRSEDIFNWNTIV